MTEAADVLRAGLTHQNANVRFRYAAKVLELGVKACELTELVERVQQLERRLASQSPVYRGPPPNQTVDDVK
jgi:hypothetical protein